MGEILDPYVRVVLSAFTTKREVAPGLKYSYNVTDAAFAIAEAISDLAEAIREGDRVDA